MHLPSAVDAQVSEMVLDLAKFAVGIASCDSGLSRDNLAWSFSVFASIVMGVEAVFGGESAATCVVPPVAGQLFDWRRVVSVIPYLEVEESGLRFMVPV